MQRDHMMLMQNLKRLLRRGGAIMFSNNKRGFKMDLDGLARLGLQAQGITKKRCRKILRAIVKFTTAGWLATPVRNKFYVADQYPWRLPLFQRCAAVV